MKEQFYSRFCCLFLMLYMELCVITDCCDKSELSDTCKEVCKNGDMKRQGQCLDKIDKILACGAGRY